MQFEGPANVHPPLVALHQGEQQLRLLEAPPPLQQTMRNYCGSVRFDRSGCRFAVSSPRGGVVTFWSAATGELLASRHPDGTQRTLVGYRWDNHLSAR
ncbi:MAG: hypothetical protein RLZ44_1515 [Pseudomonadota bacterium]